MNKLTMLRLLVVVFLALSAIVVEAQDNRRAESPGLEPYIPTKLEWFALDLNSRNTNRNIAYNGFVFSYSPAGPDTIVLSVGYLPNVDKAAMNAAIEGARKAFEEQKKEYKWNWVKIKEEYKRY